MLLLADAFLRRLAAANGTPVRQLSHAVSRRLLAHSWPGNIRELENCIESAVAVARGDIAIEDLPARIIAGATRATPLPNDGAEPERLDEVERRHVLRVLEKTGGNKRRAAELLGIARKTLYRRLAAWGVDDGADPPKVVAPYKPTGGEP